MAVGKTCRHSNGEVGQICAHFQDRSHDLVRAREVQLVDESGQVWIELRHDSTETGLFILDEPGDTRIGAAHFTHGGGGIADDGSVSDRFPTGDQ
jgi:hypothetical protein